MFCLLVAGIDPTGVRAVDAVKAANLGGAQAMNLEGEIGAVRAGMKADLVVIDLNDAAPRAQKSGSMGYEGNEAGERANHISEGMHHRIGFGLLGRHGLR
jgi:adenine deaminase